MGDLSGSLSGTDCGAPLGSKCTWHFSGGFGTTLGIRILCTLRSFAPSFKLEYCLNDEAVMGRCSTRGGGGGNCPVGNTHRIYQSVDRSP